MKLINYVCFGILVISTQAFCFYRGSEYMPPYEGRAGATYITPSRFGPVGYTKNTGWDSGNNQSCYANSYKNRNMPVRTMPVYTKPRIIQK